MKNKKSTTKPKPKKPKAKKAAPRAGRTIAVVTGLKVGDDNLAPQPRVMANVAFDLGRVDRKTFLVEIGKKIETGQPIGRLFSFHKPQLVKGKYLKFEKVPRDRFLAETGTPETPAPTPPPAVVAAPAAADPTSGTPGQAEATAPATA